MIAADTSTWVAFLEGGAGEDAQLLDKALEDRQVAMVPVVLTELSKGWPGTSTLIFVVFMVRQAYLEYIRNVFPLSVPKAKCDLELPTATLRRANGI